jgi:MFS family permease
MTCEQRRQDGAGVPDAPPTDRLGRGLATLLGAELVPEERRIFAAIGFRMLGVFGLVMLAPLWLANGLGLSPPTVGLYLSASAVVAAAAGYVSGHLSDSRGRRVVLLVGSASLPVLAAGLLLAPDAPQVVGLVAALGMAAVEGLTFAPQQALLTDVASGDQDETERLFGMSRVVECTAGIAAPAAGGVLAGIAWNAWLGGLVAAGILAVLATIRALPRRLAVDVPRDDDSGPRRTPFRDGGFLALYAGNALFQAVYLGTQVVLPVVLTTAHGYTPRSWGLLIALNPLLVVVAQLRVARLVARSTAAVRLLGGGLCMVLAIAVPYLSLRVGAIVVLVVLATAGEILWGPTITSAVAERAPEASRGAWLGAFTTSFSVSFALAPVGAFALWHGAGERPLWMALAICGALGAVVASRAGGRRTAAAGHP